MRLSEKDFIEAASRMGKNFNDLLGVKGHRKEDPFDLRASRLYKQLTNVRLTLIALIVLALLYTQGILLPFQKLFLELRSWLRLRIFPERILGDNTAVRLIKRECLINHSEKIHYAILSLRTRQVNEILSRGKFLYRALLYYIYHFFDRLIFVCHICYISFRWIFVQEISARNFSLTWLRTLTNPLEITVLTESCSVYTISHLKVSGD
jgi:hypothetical protein